MFSSIRWKFIVVYFLLVFIAMVIIGVFIVNSLENQQLENISISMEQQLETIVSTSSDIAGENWLENRQGIQNTIEEWRLGAGETLYVIYDEEVPTILASSLKQAGGLMGQNALSYKNMDQGLILSAFNGDKGELIIRDESAGKDFMHRTYPVLSSLGRITGVLYMTADLSNIARTVDDSKVILTNATLIALLITIILGFLIASSITEPIRDVTKKAEEMSLGDFDQFVEVKSDDEIGQLAGMFNQLTTKLKLTIGEMDLERSKLDTIFSYMAEGVIAVDRDGRLIHANPIGQKLMELDEESIHSGIELDLSYLDLGNIDYSKPETLDGEKIYETIDGVYKVKYAPYRNERDDIAGIIMVFQDITQEHKLESMRKEFVANVSHELKTPITTIKSYTETLMDEGVELDVQKRFLSVIDSECDRMARLVRDLLQLSNIDYKKTKWVSTELFINQLLQDIISKLEVLARDKGQRISMSFAEPLPVVMGDKDGIEQVLINIISNAIKYTESGGVISINTTNDADKVRIKVSDNGIGIPEEDLNRIFERFYRVEKGRSRDLGGTGLGLSIAKEIIEAHNGEIILKSKYGSGTTVEVILPSA